MSPKACLVGAVLAGGRSRRMGAAKGGMPLPDGRTLGQAAADALAPLCPGGVVVLGHGEGLPDALPRIADLRPGEGPLAGLEALLASGRGEAYLVCPCDLPGLTPDALRPLAEAVVGGSDPPGALLHVYDDGAGRMHLPLALRARALPAISALLERGERRLGALRGAVTAALIPPDPALAPQLRGANTPEELLALTGSPSGEPRRRGSSASDPQAPSGS